MKWKGIGSVPIEECYKYLSECFSYCGKTGELSWRQRPAEHFESITSMKRWMSRCYGKQVGYVIKGRYTEYRRVKLVGASIEVHTICWILHHGRYPDGDIDHLDGDGLNNRASNLRDHDNCKNRRLQKSNRSGIVGVFWSQRRGKWTVTGDSDEKHLGYYHSLFDAACRRRSWEFLNGYTPDYGGKRGIKSEQP